MMTSGTCNAVRMLMNGWTVKYLPAYDAIEWRSPFGVSGDTWRSSSLDDPPCEAVEEALRLDETCVVVTAPCPLGRLPAVGVDENGKP